MDERTYEPGEMIVYANGDRWEVGVVKCQMAKGRYACWYSKGDTSAVTPADHMHPLFNDNWAPVLADTLASVLTLVPRSEPICIWQGRKQLMSGTKTDVPECLALMRVEKVYSVNNQLWIEVF